MRTIIDTHTHLYHHYDVRLFLERSWDTLETLLPGAQKVLILTERLMENYFGRAKNSKTIGLFSVLTTEEDESLIVQLDEKRDLILIAGRQYTSSEGIEVLALGTTDLISDRQPAASLVTAINAQNAIAVIPWSFGKWMFKKKAVVRDLIADTSLQICLGDIHGRSFLMGGDDLFHEAKNAGRKILFGTDPLPMGGEEAMSGALCTSFSEVLNPTHPARSFKALCLSNEPVRIGRQQEILTALSRQVCLRVK